MGIEGLAFLEHASWPGMALSRWPRSWFWCNCRLFPVAVRAAVFAAWHDAARAAVFGAWHDAARAAVFAAALQR